MSSMTINLVRSFENSLALLFVCNKAATMILLATFLALFYCSFVNSNYSAQVYMKLCYIIPQIFVDVVG